MNGRAVRGAIACVLLAASWTPAGASPFSGPGPRIEVSAREGTELPSAEQVAWIDACAAVAPRLGVEDGRLRLTLAQARTVEEFVAETGRPRFEAAALTGGVIWMMPPRVWRALDDRDGVRRHECVHAWLRHLGLPPLPVLLEESLALHLSGQASRLPPAPPLSEAELAPAARRLARPTDRRAHEETLARLAATFGPSLTCLEAPALLEHLRAVARGGRRRAHGLLPSDACRRPQ